MASAVHVLRRAVQRPAASAAWRRWLPKAHAIAVPCSQRAMQCRYSSNSSAASTTQAGDAAAFDRVVAARFSCHSYDSSKAIPSDVLQRVIDHTLPYRCIIVDDAAVKSQLADAMLGRNTVAVATAPVTVVFLADLKPMRRINDLVALERDNGVATPLYLKSLPTNVSTFAGCGSETLQLAKRVALDVMSRAAPTPTPSSTEAWAFKNTMPAATTMLLAATSQGLATKAMEGFDGNRVRAVLGVPSSFAVPVVITLGYAEASGTPAKGSARFQMVDLVLHNAFDSSWEASP